MPLQQFVLRLHFAPAGLHPPLPASALSASPKQASAMPARPMPNFFSACRRVADWARPLASSSNFWFITFLSLWLVIMLRTQVRLPYHVRKIFFFEKISKKWLIDYVSLP